MLNLNKRKDENLLFILIICENLKDSFINDDIEIRR